MPRKKISPELRQLRNAFRVADRTRNKKIGRFKIRKRKLSMSKRNIHRRKTALTIKNFQKFV